MSINNIRSLSIFKSQAGTWLITGSDVLAPDERWRILGFYFMLHGAAAIATGATITMILQDADGFEFGRTLMFAPNAPSANPVGGTPTPWQSFPEGLVGRQLGSSLNLVVKTGTGADMTSGYAMCFVSAVVEKTQ